MTIGHGRWSSNGASLYIAVSNERYLQTFMLHFYYTDNHLR